MHPKMVMGYTGFGKGVITIPFLKQLTLSGRKNLIQYKRPIIQYTKLRLYDYT